MKNLINLNYKFKAFLAGILIFFSTGTFAQSGMTENEVVSYLNIILVLIGMVVILLILVAIFTYKVLNIILAKPEGATDEETAEAEDSGMWANLQSRLTNAVPVEEEDKVMLDHEYDGIRELDNHLPPWWKWLFYVTIIFAVVYLFAYHVIDVAPLQAEEYQLEMARAEENQAEQQLLAGNLIDENSVEFVSEEASLANGQQIYMNMCAACHRPDGGGSVGPNLTDEFWLHGGSISDIFKTIKYGVPEKGMISWEAQIKPADMQDLSSYIISIQGTNPANPKEPQGEKYVPEESSEPATEPQEDTASEGNV